MNEVRMWHDDVRPAPEGWRWVRTNAEAIELLQNENVVECSLDHDMGYDGIEIPDDPDEMMDVLILRGQSEENGLRLVEWMIENDRVPGIVTIHSWNPDGAKRMAERLSVAGHGCVIAAFRP